MILISGSHKYHSLFISILLMLTMLFMASCTSLDANDNVAVKTQQQHQPDKRIALSFDDIPRHKGAFLSPIERRKMLITALRDGGVQQAVFFINPTRINDTNRASIEAYAHAGHALANHSADHVKLSHVTAAEFLADIDAAEAWLESNDARRPWMRFPYLDEGGSNISKRDLVRAGLQRRDLRNGYVTIDASDWLIDSLAAKAVKAGKDIDKKALGNMFVESHILSANFADDLARRTLGRSPVHMMLLHEADVTALYLADLIAALKSDGWDIVSADAAYADPLGNMRSEKAFAAGTILEMLASDKDITPRWFERNNEKFAEKLFNERVLHEENINQ